MVKTKSVERDKKKKADIINTNKNTNNQIVQILFPNDVELRKVKKKKKRKPSNTKKRDELLETLKQNLENYDNLQQQAQQLKIKIPTEIGISVINRSDLKTDTDIQNYIDDVSKKTTLLQELINKNKQVNLFSISTPFPNRLGSGIINLPTLPPAIPQTIMPTPVAPIPTSSSTSSPSSSTISTKCARRIR